MLPVFWHSSAICGDVYRGECWQRYAVSHCRRSDERSQLPVDFFYYWYHRAQHTIPFLWRFHAVHHSIEDLNATNCSHHWLEGFFKAFAVSVPLSLLIELHYPEVALVGLIFGQWGQLVHADSRLDFGPLRWLVVSPRFHRVHHSTARRHFDKNFAGQFAS